MFCIISILAGVIGSYFIEDIVDAADPRTKALTFKYVHLLDRDVISAPKHRFGDKFKAYWFQQDGASPHTA